MECGVFDDSEDISNYSSLLEIAEKIVALVEMNGEKHYPTIRQELMKCSQEIDIVIALEENPNNFLMTLFQQKQQLNRLIKLTEHITDGQIQLTSKWNSGTGNMCHKHFKVCSSKMPKTKDDTQEKLLTILQSVVEIPKIRGLHEVIGLYNVKKVLKSLVVLPKTQPQLFYNRPVCNSILLYGPPGTGKTRLAHGIAAEANGVFLCISAGDILSHFVGQTEKTIKSIFTYLKESSEFTVLFIDEIDAVCRKRTNSELDHTRRLKTEFMCQMSNVEDNRNLFIVCATNCPWDLDPAILRRLQKHLYIPLPNQSERFEMFQFLTTNNYFEENFNDWTGLIKKTEGYSGSDVFNVVQTALMIPLTELEDTKIWKRCHDGFFEPVLEEQDFSTVVCSELCDLPSNSVRARKARMNDLLNATDSVKSTVTQSDVKKYECFNGN